MMDAKSHVDDNYLVYAYATCWWLWKENKRTFLISQLRWHASRNFLFLKLSTLDTF